MTFFIKKGTNSLASPFSHRSSRLCCEHSLAISPGARHRPATSDSFVYGCNLPAGLVALTSCVNLEVPDGFRDSCGC